MKKILMTLEKRHPGTEIGLEKTIYGQKKSDMTRGAEELQRNKLPVSLV